MPSNHPEPTACPEICTTNRVLLPPACLEALMAGTEEMESPFTFRLTLKDKTTHCGVKDFTAPPGCMLMPKVMLEALGASDGDGAIIQQRKLPKGTLVKLQPLESDFFGIPDHKAALEGYLRTARVTLSVGDTIAMRYGGANALRRTSSIKGGGSPGSGGKDSEQVYHLGVTELSPARAVCIIDTDLEVDLAGNCNCSALSTPTPLRCTVCPGWSGPPLAATALPVPCLPACLHTPPTHNLLNR